ncbi:MAG: dihydroorotase [Cyanobacteria bacterium J007]|nr:MAG: dihydroorotase [Cyanobacteria bacterium J007]
MSTSQLIQQVRILDPVTERDQIADIWIVDGVIRAVDGQLSEAVGSDTDRIDGRGSILGPGLVDLYSHSGEPGFEERETLASLQQAAWAGGFTRVAVLPDTVPVLDNPAGLSFVRRRVEEGKVEGNQPQLGFWGALTLGGKGEQMSELAELAAAGIVGFADDRPVEHLGLLRRILEYIGPLGKPVALWPCRRDLAGNGVAREGSASVRLGLPGHPAIAETSALSALLELVEAIATPVHIMRVSTARSVELIAHAKGRGVPVTASTSWMHLLLDTEALASYDPSLRLDPPLGNPGDRRALIQGIDDGTIDAIAIDHRGYTYEEKTVAFSEAPAGAIGLELALPLLWQEFVATEKLSPLTLWKALSLAPARCLQQEFRAIAPGEPAELTLFDPQTTWTADGRSLRSLSHNTPWLGQTITGRVARSWLKK